MLCYYMFYYNLWYQTTLSVLICKLAFWGRRWGSLISLPEWTARESHYIQVHNKRLCSAIHSSRNFYILLHSVFSFNVEQVTFLSHWQVKTFTNLFLRDLAKPTLLFLLLCGREPHLNLQPNTYCRYNESLFSMKENSCGWLLRMISQSIT